MVWVVEWMVLLYVATNHCSFSSHDAVSLLRFFLMKLFTDWLSRSTCPLVWGWYADVLR